MVNSRGWEIRADIKETEGGGKWHVSLGPLLSLCTGHSFGFCSNYVDIYIKAQTDSAKRSLHGSACFSQKCTFKLCWSCLWDLCFIDWGIASISLACLLSHTTTKTTHSPHYRDSSPKIKIRSFFTFPLVFPNPYTVVFWGTQKKSWQIVMT